MAEEYYHQDYPKMVFNPNGQIAIVQSKEEQTALGADWHDSPADYGVETCPAAPVAVEGGYYGTGYTAPRTGQTHGLPPQSQTIPTPQTGIMQPQPPPPEEARQEVQRLEDEAGRSRRGRSL